MHEETGPASSDLLQEGLPSVLVLEIFQYLDFHSLLKCRLVCSGFLYLIDSTASLQYPIELAVAGQQDGSYGDMSTRREMLKTHQERWDGLQWTEVLRVPKMPTHWGLYGGVFAEVNPETCTLHFKRIPSRSRGIKEKTWILDLSTFLGESQLGDFGMDPGQDLLVIIAGADNGLIIHLLTLSKGERHPLTSEPCLVPDDLSYGELQWFYIDICHDFLSIHSVGGAVVWNWKTGQIFMHIIDDTITSMVFLNERYVLMAVMGEDQPCLLAVDFLAEPPEERGLNEVKNSFVFRFPAISHSPPIHDIIVRSNPRSTWGADTDPSLPFSMVPQDRLFLVHILSNSTNEDLCFAILETSFLSLLKTADNLNNIFYWSMWGPEHSRALPNYSYSPIWLLPSHGTRLALKRYLPHHGRVVVDVYDFNQLGCRNKKQDNDVETPGNMEVSESSEIIEGRTICASAPTIIKANVFHDQVITGLGYRMTSWLIPGKTQVRAISAMCSEDAVIIVDETNEMYEIYTV